ncbi:hypothetical protein PV-S19_0001 [Pacmanvirus S19]|nr:hypothetical protein PV-S19_0001 [Pacmanvirus S19]
MEQLILTSKIRGGKFTEITKDKAIFVCDNNHVSIYTKANIERRIKLNRWVKCFRTICVEKPKKIYEKEFGKILHDVFNIPFTKVRPFWLVNPKTGKNLEIDFYNEEYKLGFEYQELHHFQPTKHRNLKQTQKYDKMKAIRCEMLGIKLFQIIENDDADAIRDSISEITLAIEFKKIGITSKSRRHSI